MQIDMIEGSLIFRLIKLQMQLHHRLTVLICDLGWRRSAKANGMAYRTDELTNLANSIIDYASDRRFSSNNYVTVEVDELMHCFRDTRMTVTGALELLEADGLAKSNKRYGVWEINVSKSEIKTLSGDTVGVIGWRSLE